MEIESVAKFVGYVGAIGGGAWTVYTKILKPMFKALKTRYANLEAIPEIQNDLKMIRDQLVPNGGSSLRDSVDRLEANQVIMGQKHGVILAMANIALMQTDVKGRVIDVSEPLCRMLERSREELLGDNWISAIHPDDREDIERDWQNAVDDHRNFEGRFRFMLPDGRCVSAYMKMPAMQDYRGRPQGFMGTVQAKS